MNSNQLDIVSPTEMNGLLDQISTGLGQPSTLATFRQRWQTAYDQFGQNLAGELAYRDALLYFQEEVVPLLRRLPVSESGQQAITTISSILTTNLMPPKRINRQLLAQMRQRRLINSSDRSLYPVRADISLPNFDRPIFIVSAPRAGSTLLFETLAHFAEVWSIGRESHDIEADIPELHPAAHNYSSNRLTEPDATPMVSQAVQSWFSQRLQNREGVLYLSQSPQQRPATVRFLEKTPKNALRIPFLKTIFPEARFIYLYREPRQNISSMLEGWRSRRFVAYRDIPGWPYKEWSFLLVPGWEGMVDRPLVEIAAQQWQTANTYILEDLEALPEASWCAIRYTDLIRRPAETIKTISHLAELGWTEEIEAMTSQSLPISHMALSPPSADKWQKNKSELMSVYSTLETLIKRVDKSISPKK